MENKASIGRGGSPRQRGDPASFAGQDDMLATYVKNVDSLHRKLARIVADHHETAASLRRAAQALRSVGAGRKHRAIAL